MSLLIAAAAEPDPNVHIERHGLFKLWGDAGHEQWFTNHLLMSLVATSLGVVILMAVAKAMQPRPEQGAKGYVTRSRFGGFFELILVYLRDEAVKPLLLDKTDKYIGILWSIFFFVLFGNLLGMMPIGPVLGLVNAHWAHVGGTFTGNINFTLGLAVVACLLWLFAGLKEGGMGYIKHYWVVPLQGQPVALWPLLIVVGILIAVLEIAGNVLIKPFALCVRLLANMMAGHLVLGSILLMSVVAFDAGSYIGAGISFLGALAISFLELFVAFLQAYIFMFLTAIFISLGLPHDHDHDHGPEGVELPDEAAKHMAH